MAAVRLILVCDGAGVLLRIAENPPEGMACAQCGVVFNSRNMLFRHLKTLCLPAVATLCPPKSPPVRLVLVVRYVGHAWYGFQTGSAEQERLRPSIAGQYVAAVQRAWGDVVTRSVAPRAAVRTEKGASATRNVLVLTLHKGCGGFVPDEASLRRELPGDIDLVAPPRIVPASLGLHDVWHAVRRQTQAVLVPYSAMLRCLPDVDEALGFSMWLSGLPDATKAADVRSLMRDALRGLAGGGEMASSDFEPAIEMPTCGGFVDVRFSSLAALDCALRELDGLEWRGSRLLALRGDEAAAKLKVHQRVKNVLRRLSTAKHFRNFVDPKGSNAAGSAQRKLQHCSSGVHTDWRPRRGVRPLGAWYESDWCEVRLSAREFGAQQCRRMIGVLIAVVRGTEGDEYLQRCLDSRQSVATPLAPAEATWLDSIVLDAKEADGYLGDRGGASGGGASDGDVDGDAHCLGTGHSDFNEGESAFIRSAIVAGASSLYRDFIDSLEGGDATRGADDARLRAAAAAGDTATVAALLDAGVARCSGVDEYGRTALFLAAAAGHIDVAESLLEHGARVSQAANGGWMPRAAAAAMGHTALASRLAMAGAACPHAGAQPVLWKALAYRGIASASKDDAAQADSTAVTGPRDDDAATEPHVRTLVPLELDGHPGSGTLSIDDALPPGSVDALLQLWRSLPTAPKDKPSPIDRAYYADVDGCLAHVIDGALKRAGVLRERDRSRPAAQPLVRFLHYATVGGSLPAHVDLPRVVDGERTTHSFLLYLTDCERGGETLLLEAKPGDERLKSAGGVAPGERSVIAVSAPRRGRLLIMPHACPHAAAPVDSVPKTLIRGELLLG